MCLAPVKQVLHRSSRKPSKKHPPGGPLQFDHVPPSLPPPHSGHSGVLPDGTPGTWAEAVSGELDLRAKTTTPRRMPSFYSPKHPSAHLIPGEQWRHSKVPLRTQQHPTTAPTGGTGAGITPQTPWVDAQGGTGNTTSVWSDAPDSRKGKNSLRDLVAKNASRVSLKF